MNTIYTRVARALLVRLARWSSVFVVLLTVTYVTVYKQYENGPPIRSDGSGYHIWNYAFIKGDLSCSWYDGDPQEVALIEIDPEHHRFACKFPPGLALLRLPVMVFVTDPANNGLPYSKGEHWACLIFGALVLVVTVGLLLDACYQLGATPVWANLTVLLLTFGTGLFHYATYDAAFSHAYSAAFAAALVWLAARALGTGQRLPLAAVVLCAAELFLLRTTNALLLGFWGLGGILISSELARRSPHFRLRVALGASLGLALGLAITLSLNYMMFDRIILHTYTNEHFTWDNPNMLKVLGGERHGAFRLYPVLAIPILAGLLARGTRLAAVWLLAVYAAYTVLYGHWWTWHLACGFGHRGFVDLVPFAFPVMAVAFSRMPRYLSIPLAILAIAAAYYTSIQMYQYWLGEPYIPLAEMFELS
jgi:hypothetical protein